jgi:integrase
MPLASKTGHVKKRCECVRWKECTHPWYVDYFTKARGRYRPNLDALIGRHCVDIADAKTEARRAIAAWEQGRDPRELLVGERPTLAALLDAYATRTGASATDAAKAGPITRAMVGGRPFGELRAEAVTPALLDAFRRVRPRIGASRDLALLRAAYNWAVLGDLVPATPFKVGGVSAVQVKPREEGRTRRLQPGEEARLLAACDPGLTKNGHRPWPGNRQLRDVVVAALETACRIGELLSLQWSQVREDLFLPAGKTKAKKPRRVPISMTLRAVLESRQLDPAGERFGPDAFVFGDEIGRRRASVDKAWLLACGRAGIMDLHIHDLRREAGSRWMDAGVPLATIQRWLGHYNIAQTSTYLAATGGGDADAMRLYEARIGRVDGKAIVTGNETPVTISDNSSPETRPNRPSSDQPSREKTSKSANVAERRTVH